MKLLTSLLCFFVNFNLLKCTYNEGYIIKRVFQLDGNLLESPQWSTDEDVLYCVDKIGQKIFRLDPETVHIEFRDIDYGPTSLVVPVKDAPGLLLVGVRSELFFLKWGAPGGDQALRLLSTVDIGKPDNQMNDGKIDEKGRLWFGTIGKGTGLEVVPDQATLYSVDYKNFRNPEIKLRPVSLSNGIAWSLDNCKMYYIDSPTRTIQGFDFILETGEIGNKTIVFNFDEYNLPGFGDGMTIDVDGNLWVATFEGARIERTQLNGANFPLILILKIDPLSGELLDQILLPVDQVSSVIWGGKDFSTLYVTTGKLTVTDPLPLSGSVFAITNTGTKGRPEPQFVFPSASEY